MIQLSSKERAFLRKLAHNLEPIVRIGKDGIDENVLKSIAEVVKKRELIKVKILKITIMIYIKKKFWCGGCFYYEINL